MGGSCLMPVLGGLPHGTKFSASGPLPLWPTIEYLKMQGAKDRKPPWCQPTRTLRESSTTRCLWHGLLPQFSLFVWAWHPLQSPSWTKSWNKHLENNPEILLAQGAHTYGLSLRSSQRWRLKLPSIAGDVDRYGWRYTWSLRPTTRWWSVSPLFREYPTKKIQKSTWGFPFWGEEESIPPGTKAACMMYGILVDSSI